MAEINDWIKEQLKKGYSKEQIKEGLRKAGYPQNTINSVDSIAKKRRNFNIALVFFIVIIVGIAFYLTYQNMSSNSEGENNEEEILEILTGEIFDITSDGFEPKENLKILEGPISTGGIFIITSDSYEPKQISIKENQNITFINQDTIKHTLITNSSFEFKEIESKNFLMLIFREKGEFEFYFEEWPEIKGQIVVSKGTE